MIANIDKTELSVEQRGYPYRQKLEELVEAVATVNPLLTFKCDANCVTRDWERDVPNPNNGALGSYVHYIYKVKVFQDGEELGALLVNSRYRRNVGCEMVYGIESFRIHKERGRDDTTFTKDLKVALRTAKKALVGRETQEIFTHIYNQLSTELQQMAARDNSAVRYSIDISEEVMVYARAAYQACLEGKDTVEMPVKLSTVKNHEEYLNKCEMASVSNQLASAFKRSEGYPAKVLEDGQIITLDLEHNKVVKYKSIEEMPTAMANKFAMFKVLGNDEAHLNIGVKFHNGFFYIAK